MTDSISFVVRTVAMLGVVGLANLDAIAEKVALQMPTATISQSSGWDVNWITDGATNDTVGWAVYNFSRGGAFSEIAVVETVENIGFRTGSRLRFTLYHVNHNPQHSLGRFRLSYTTDSRDTFADGLNSGGDVTANWVVITPLAASGSGGELMTIRADGSIVVSGPNPLTTVYSVTTEVAAQDITGFRIEALEDPSLPASGPGRYPSNGNFVLTEFTADIVPVPNAPPVVEITRPVEGTVVVEGDVELEAIATDRDGIAQVDFFAGAEHIATSTAGQNPRAVTWPGVVSGTYVLTARATDALGASSTSAPISLVVNARPQVVLAAPVSGSSFIVGDTIELVPAVSDRDGSVVRVQFLLATADAPDFQPLASSSALPFTVSVSDLPVALTNSLRLKAIAVDNQGAAKESEIVFLSVNTRPIVRLDSPPDGVLVQEGAGIGLLAEASNAAGAIAVVEFVAESSGTFTSISSITTSPYAYTWENIMPGRYTLRAWATSIYGVRAGSVPVSARVNARPQIALTRSNLTYSEGAGTVSLDALSSVFDVDWQGGGMLSVAIVSNALPEDRLAVAGQVVQCAEPLTVPFGRDTTIEDIRAVLRSLTYANMSENPSPATRQIRILLTDGDGGVSAPAFITIDVQSLNDPPHAITQDLAVSEDGSLNIVLNAEDVDGDALTFSIVGPPSHGVLRGSGANLTYSPNANYFGSDVIRFVAHDGQVASPIASIRIAINSVNDAPVAVAELVNGVVLFPDATHRFVIAPDNRRALIILDASGSSDPDGDSLTFGWFLNEALSPVATGVVARVQLDVGRHRVALVADDGSDLGTEVLTVDVVSVAEAIDEIILFLHESTIPSIRIRPLLASLKAAQASFDRDGFRAGSNQIRALQNKIRVQVQPGEPLLAGALVAALQKVLDAIGD